MPRLTSELATELDYFRLLRRRQLITKSEFEREKKKILNEQERLDELERQRRLQAEFLRREAEKKAKRLEALRKKKEDKKALSDLIFRGTCGESPTPFLRRAYEATLNHATIRVVAEFENALLDITVPRPATVEEFVKLFFVYEGGEFKEYMGEGGTLLLFRPTPLPATRLRQLFRDGINHCVFTPILNKLQQSLESCQSKDSAKRYKQRINKLNDLEEVYSAGVPEDKMEDVAKASGFKIIIHNILGQQMNVYNENGKLGVIKFTNTRPNHIDEGHMTLDQDYIEVSEKEIRNLWMKARMDDAFYMFEGDIKNGLPRKLRLLDKAYKVHDPNQEFFKEMDEMVGIHKFRFNATKYPEVNEFIKSGRIINAWATPFSNDTPTGHLDMPKAYTQFKKCAWYAGFLGVIHQWSSGNFNRQWLEEHIGIYECVVLKNDNMLFNKLGMTVGSKHVLPSVELLYFMDRGVELSISKGVWGSRTDFEFPEKMLDNHLYCLWSGRLGMERHSRNFSFHSNEEWASHVKSEFGDNCFYWKDKQICSVHLPVKNVFTTHHLFAFITSYVRIQMMEAMSQFKLEQLVRVVLDGIYFVGDRPMGLEWFREKEIKKFRCDGFEWYLPVEETYDFPSMIVKGHTLLSGQGGAGKTHMIMTHPGFNKVLYVSPQHLLGQDVNKKYGAEYTTINKLVGIDCCPYVEERAYPPVIALDELTQVEAQWVEKVFKLYPHSLILLIGDVNSNGQWFQCRNGCPDNFSKIWKPSGIDILHVEGDRRSRDDELRALKLKIRSVMEQCFVDGDSGENTIIQAWARKNLRIVSFDDAVKMFQPGDSWIAGTHKTSEKLLENGVVSGWYKAGGHVSFVEPMDASFKKRGSFTIHSFQGRTIEQGKIFISLKDTFEYAMFYTAVSRAVNYSQLVFVL